MRVAVIQSSFIPWRGYFDFIKSVDLFVFYDSVQYSKNGWRNRNRIKTPLGPRWITVPVRHRSLSQLICETDIDETRNWRANHMLMWHENYSRAPYFEDVLSLLDDLGTKTAKTISELNIDLTKKIAAYLGIGTPIAISSDYEPKGTKTDRLLDLLHKTGARTYLSGPSADAYLDKNAFRAAGIRLEYKSYDYDPYPQLWGDFQGAVSILDLVANCGPLSMHFVRSKTQDKVVID